VDDCGNIVNPLIVEGQIQGVGQALLERLWLDAGGQLLSSSLGDYALPRATDMPQLVFDHTVTPSQFNPLGAKGVGKAGTIGCPPAVANVVLDALASLGIRHLDFPFSAERIWQAMLEARGDRP
jgi:carbon-monoxide dehydrogenase large subunit